MGVLVEQGLWRTSRLPGQNQVPVANVLWAAPLPVVLDALGLTSEVRPYGDWNLVSPEWAFFLTMQTDPFDPLVAYAGLGDGQGMYRSSDGGRHWERINRDLAAQKIRSIAVSSFDSRLYAATDAGLWLSDDRGANWREDPHYKGKSLLSVALSPHDPDLLLVGCQYPGGASASAGTASVLSSSLAASVREGTEGNGLKISRDRGASWVTLPKPETVNALWIDPEDSRVFAVASADDGFFFSRQGLQKLRRAEASQ